MVANSQAEAWKPKNKNPQNPFLLSSKRKFAASDLAEKEKRLISFHGEAPLHSSKPKTQTSIAGGECHPNSKPDYEIIITQQLILLIGYMTRTYMYSISLASGQQLLESPFRPTPA